MSNRIKIVNATAEDFALESLGSQPTSGSVDDHADGRIVKYGTSVYIWDNTLADWVRFAPLVEYTSVETRISVQEADRATAISSHQTVDGSLQTRISVEESTQVVELDSVELARSQAVSTELAARESVDSSLETRLSNEEVNRAADVSSEASRAASSEASLEAVLSSAVVAREADVSAEASRAASSEASLELRLSQEESNEDVADASLTTRLSAQESDQLAAANSLNTVLAARASSRLSADTSLETRLSLEEAKVDAILAGTSVPDLENFSAVVSYVNALDVVADASLSSEFSELTSSIVSSEASLEAKDDSLETRLSEEESTEVSAEGSLVTRVSNEEVARASVDVSLTARLSGEESTKLAEDNSLASDISTAAAARASVDTSLTTRLSEEESTELSAEGSLDVRVSNEEVARENADDSLELRLSQEESNEASAISSLEANVSEQIDTDENSAMLSADVSLTARVSSEEVARAAADASLTVRISNEEVARENADDSLEVRLSEQESNENVAVASLDVRISNEESAMASADASLDTELTSQIDVVDSMVDAVLLDAAADKDTFVEIMSFIQAVDLAADDELASYISSVDADISSEASSMALADSSLATRISAEESARASAVSAEQSRAESAEDSVETAVSTLEAAEDNRHLRIDFTNQTSFTVAQGDLPSGFSAGNGMVQIFHEISSGTYRHLVAPATYNPSTGAMTFDLGSTAKDGFAVFYSFAGDDTAAAQQFQFGTTDSGYDFNNPPTALSQTFSGAVYNSSSIKILDHENQEWTDPYGSGYNQWVVKNPFSIDSEYDSQTFQTTYTPYVNWGSPGDTGLTIKYYSQQSTDNGSTWSSTGTYTDTFSYDSSGGYYNNYDSGFSMPNTSYNFPAQTATLGSAYRIWAEGYNAAGDLVIQVGSESSPYYFLDQDYDMNHYSASVYNNGSYVYWDSTNESDYVSATLGDTVSISLANPSGVSAGDSIYDNLINFNVNSNASSYSSFDPYSTDWALSGTDASEFDLDPYTTGNQTSSSDQSYAYLTFKDVSGSRSVPSAGTYNVTVTAQAQTSSSASNVGTITWNIQVVIS